MEERVYLCRQCRGLFRLPLSSISSSDKEVPCPRCGSSQTSEVPDWAPLHSGLSTGQPVWEYECQQCRNAFKLPAPRSPSHEKEIKCPACGGGHIHRLAPVGGMPLYCG